MLNREMLIKAEIKYHMTMMKVGMKLSKHKLTKRIGDDLFDRHALENLIVLSEFVDVVKTHKKVHDEIVKKLDDLENDLQTKEP